MRIARLLAILACGCGPVAATSVIDDADAALARAHAAEGDKYALYETTLADLYLVKARFHWLLRRVAKTVRRRRNEATMSTKSITSTVSTTPRTANECWFETHDGTRLFYRHWPSEQGFSQQAIILLHRGHEHSGRLQHVVDVLQLPEMAMFAWDARGHGRSTHEDEAPASLATAGSGDVPLNGM